MSASGSALHSFAKPVSGSQSEFRCGGWPDSDPLRVDAAAGLEISAALHSCAKPVPGIPLRVGAAAALHLFATPVSWVSAG